jgi:hypothetical protein
MSKPVRFLCKGKAFWLDVDPPSEVAIRRITEHDPSKGTVLLTTHAGVTDTMDGDVDSAARQVWPEHFSSEETDGNR